MDIELKKYEISFLLRKEGDFEKIAVVLKRHGATRGEEVDVSRIKLSYPIARESFGYFGYVLFTADPKALGEIENDLRTSTDVMRFSIFGAPRVQPTTRGSRDGRSFRQESYEARRRRAPRVIKETGASENKSPLLEERRHIPKPEPEGELTNEALEKKLEEILK